VATHPEGRTPIDRVAIVTGGSRGVGRVVARELAGRDYAVVIHYARNQAAAEAAVEEVLAANGTALAVRADVADELDAARLFGETTEAFGGVDVVVHAAGGMNMDAVVDDDLDMFDALLRTNVRGMFVVNQLASRQIRSGGAIVNLSWASIGSSTPNHGAYAACKCAVEVLTPMLARELSGRDITVNAVAAVSTRLDSLAGIANVVAFLVGIEGHSVTGHVIRAEGGWFG
jgi:3-oxoacyl-[acyl-carrier protein] reductase